MNKRIFQSIIIIGMIIIINLLLTTTSNAALSISTSKATVSPGESFSVTVSVTSNEAGAINLSASNGTLSQTYVDLMSQTSVTISCVAGSSGTVTISGSGLVANYATETEGMQSASKSVTIKQPTTTTPTTTTPPTQTTTPSNNTGSTTSKPSNNTTTTTQTKSSNSKLSSLQIAEGTITPEFSKNVYEYAIGVKNEITKLNISATPDHSKATVNIIGNDELQVGENTIQIKVTAEDGSSNTYKLYVTRELPELSLQELSIYYIEEDNNKKILNIEPNFLSNIYEYKVSEKLSYKIQSLQIEAIANREGAINEIVGNENLTAGNNEIIIKVIIPNEGGVEEQKTYKIIVEKEEEPIIVNLTTTQKISNWFIGIGNTTKKWFSTNFNNIIKGMLIVATTAFIGLTIYLVYDYKRYKGLIAKLAEYNKENLMERANVAINPEIANTEPILDEQKSNLESEEQMGNVKGKGVKGKRFK